MLFARKPCLLFVLLMVMALAGCAPKMGSVAIKDKAPPFNIDAAKIPDAVPKFEPKSKYGNPKSYVIRGHRYYVLPSSKGYNQKGVASWYGWGFHGRNTSTNEKYDSLAMTAASPSLPLPTYVQVTNLDNGKKVVVKVNDRGPFVPGSNRIIDLSYAAAKKLGYAARGTAHVLVTAIDPHKWHMDKSSTETQAEKLYLQLGAFSKRANAEVLKQRVIKLVHQPVAITSVSSSSHLLYKVQIGPLLNSKESHTIAGMLAKHGLTASVITNIEKSV